MPNSLFDNLSSGIDFVGILFNLLSISVYAMLYAWRIFRRDYRSSFFLIIIFMPITYYLTRVFGIDAYTDIRSDPPFTQVIGFTTGMIIFHYLLMKINNAIIKHDTRIYRRLQNLLIIYSITLTIAQLFTHTIGDALLLSIGASWQYLALFYIFTSVVTNEQNLLKFIHSLFIYSIFNKIYIVIVGGAPWIKSLSAQYTAYSIREGNVGSLGPPMSAALYLALLFTLALGLYYYKSEKKYLLFMFFIFVEIINTFTRGAIFIMLLLFIPVYRYKRHKNTYMVISALLITIPLWNTFWRFISFRGFSVNVFEDSNFVSRFIFSYLYFKDYYEFSLVGNGLVSSTIIRFTDFLSVRLHNAFLEILDTTGIIVFFIFIAICIEVFRQLRRDSKKLYMSTYRNNILSIIVMFIYIAFIQWLIYANTTATSVLYYYPYEGTMIFWMICFSSVSIGRIAEKYYSGSISEGIIKVVP